MAYRGETIPRLIPRLCLVSPAAFLPSRWQTVQYIRKMYNVDFTVVAPPRAKITLVYDSSGYLTPRSAGLQDCPSFVTLIPLNDVEHPHSGFKAAALRAFLDKYRPDLIWIHGPALGQDTRNICKWYFFSRRPQIFQAVSEHYHRLGSGLPAIKNWILLQRITGFLPRSNSAVPGVKKNLRIPTRKIHPTYHANIAVEKSSKPQVNNDVFKIGYAGRLVPEKGIFLLLDALDLLPPNIRLFTAGAGTENVIRSLRTHPRVCHLGLLQDLSRLFSEIDILVVPSLTIPTFKEQFGRVIAEAFSCGIPVVGSDSGSIPEIVGEEGLIYPERSPQALSDRILELYANQALYRQLSANAIKRFERYFSVEASAKRLASIFNLRPR